MKSLLSVGDTTSRPGRRTGRPNLAVLKGPCDVRVPSPRRGDVGRAYRDVACLGQALRGALLTPRPTKANTEPPTPTVKQHPRRDEEIADG